MTNSLLNFGDCQLGFFIDGTHFPIDQQSFKTCKIQRGVNFALPVLELIINDRQSFLLHNNIVSGTRFTSAWYLNGERRIFDWYISEVEDRKDKEKTTRIICNLYRPKWIRGFAKPQYGSSRDVIKNLCSDCNYNFQSNILMTNDARLWMGNFTNYGMASHIASRGGYDDKSCMILAAGLEAVVYNDIFSKGFTDVFSGKILTDKPTSENDIKIYNVYVKKAKTTSQILYNYQHEIEYSGVNENYNINKTSFRKDFSEVLPINEAFYSDVGLVRREHYPLNVGNDTSFSQKAFYNNRKRKSQFLDTVMCFANNFPKVNLLEQAKVDFNGQTSSGIISNIVTTFNGEDQSISTRIDVSTTNSNILE